MASIGRALRSTASSSPAQCREEPRLRGRIRCNVNCAPEHPTRLQERLLGLKYAPCCFYEPGIEGRVLVCCTSNVPPVNEDVDETMARIDRTWNRPIGNGAGLVEGTAPLKCRRGRLRRPVVGGRRITSELISIQPITNLFNGCAIRQLGGP